MSEQVMTWRCSRHGAMTKCKVTKRFFSPDCQREQRDALEVASMSASRREVLSRCDCPPDGDVMGLSTHCPVHGHLALDMYKAEMIVERASEAGVICRECGCSNRDACEGGCSWVEPGLCSACVKTKEVDK